MKKNYIARRRGTSVAAAALSLALVAPFAQSVAVAQEAPAATAGETADQPNISDPNEVIDADMIASGRVTKASNLTDAHGVGKGLISGHVYLTSPSGNPGAAHDNGNVKLDGITVYAQFRDKDGSYSPIFSAKTHTLPNVVGGNGGQGTFAFGTGDKGITWTDKLGREHTWSARTDQKHRIWVKPFTNERGNRVQMIRQANGFVPGSFNNVSQYPLGSWVAADGNMQLMAAFLQELAPNHENSYMVAKDENGANKIEHDANGFVAGQNPWNSVSGKVWAEVGKTDAGIVATGPAYTGPDGDVELEGYKVFASTLTPEGAAQNELLHQRFKNDPGKLAEETKKMLEDHPEYILKTVSGETDKDGNYTLRFNDGQTADEQSRDRLNLDHMYLWVEDKNGVVQQGYTGFHTPVFQRFSDGGNFRPIPTPAPNVLTRDISRNRVYNVNYAVMPYAPVSITADYNATDKPAAPGVTVTPEFSGDLSPLSSKVEWRDQKGNVLKTCELDQSQGIKAQVAACTFDIPDNANKGDYFNVVLVSGGNDVSAWTVLVTKDADEYTPAYEDKLVVPDKETKSSPTFTKTGEDAEGNPTEEKVDTPEGSKFAIPEDFKAPEGYEVKIDENTGEITVTYPDKSKLNKDTVEEFDVPVTVTYPDGSKNDAKAKFKLDTDGDGTPDKEDTDDDGDGIPDEKEKEDGTNPKAPNQNLDFEPEYEDGSGKPGEDVTVPAPTFEDKDGNDTEAPEGTKFTPGEGAPEGVKVDENTGEITVPVPEDANPGDKITVPVDVTYPDGTTDTVDVTVTVDEPDAPAPVEEDKDKFEPEYEDGNGKPGEDVTVPAPTFEDKDGNDTEAPEGTKFTPGEGAPEGVKVDENTGEITVPVPEDANPGDKITVPVDVTYPDGTTDTVDVTVTVDEPAKTPGWKDATTTPGEPVEIEKDPNSGEFTPGSTVDVTEGPGTAEIDDSGKVTVTPSEEAKPGDKIVVEVKDPEGKVIDTVTVTVTDPDATQAETFDPNYEELTQVTVDGDKATNNPFGEEDAPLKNIDSKASDGSQDWEFQMQDNGVIVATAPTMAEVGEAVGEELPAIDKSWEKFVETFTPYARPTVTVDFTYEDDSKDEDVDANFDLLGKDGKSLLDPDGDFDDDGFTNKEEIEKGTNPADETSKPSEGDDVKDTTPPTVNPITEGDKTVSGTGDRPNEKIIVELPDGQKVETETDKDGNWTIDVPADVELKPGDKVIVSDGAGNKSETTVEAGEVKDTTPPTVNPIKPGDKTISGTGDRPNEEIIVELPGGQQVETTTDKDGRWTIEVPADVELKPGDKVIVSDGAGNETNAQVGIDTGKCVATSLGFGLPLLALIPLGLASQMEIPGLSNVVADANAQLQAANTRIQQQLGLFNPEIAAQVDAANRQLAQFGTDLGTVAGGLALIAAGILAGTLIYDNCSPNGGGSSVKDLQLRGSSGKTYAGSSKKDGKDAESGSSKKDDKANEQAADKK